ncbi:hypothetical protein GN244_ATG05762 [Phytophthora infestans]|uniref:C2H2-type domain-containing protein n=1 Tax=Phytophthora infestans TaxID=4787 RepID=A0A833SYE1_PHYIN|nr:hypothetical protein GN244_ATG05762 [Phytophthora infestans]
MGSKPKKAADKRCSKCKKTFASSYSMKRHLKKKNKCDKRSVKKRVAEKKARRKVQNKAYYTRRKWNISLARMPTSKVLDVLLSEIPGTSEIVSLNLAERLCLLKQNAGLSTSDTLSTQLTTRLELLNR